MINRTIIDFLDDVEEWIGVLLSANSSFLYKNKIITTTLSMSRGPTTTIPHHTHREFLARSNLGSLIGQGRQNGCERSFHNTSKSFTLKHDHQICEDDVDIFNKTASELKNANFSHHNENCQCNNCNCGRHQCKFNVIEPEMTKNSIYQRSYYQKAFIPN